MEEVTTKFISNMIYKTQERIENHFFESRKHVLEYDDVLNAQREDIYAMRREILLGKDCREELRNYVPEIMAGIVDNAWVLDEHDNREYDYNLLFEDLNEIFPLLDFATVADLQQHQPGPDLNHFVTEQALKAYDSKINALGNDVMGQIERQVMLHAVNDRWMEHLQTVEYIREGINLRSYGQVDPLIAYKRETFDTFITTKAGIQEDAVKMIYRAQVRPAEEDAPPMMLRMDDALPELLEVDGESTIPASDFPAQLTEAQLKNVDWKKVGRNDPCPCRSGKKFKACHYPMLRTTGVI
ncbi:MAG: SEC-C metal-binding domain-containing protein [Fimbriimonadaceae bacterium]